MIGIDLQIGIVEIVITEDMLMELSEKQWNQIAQHAYQKHGHLVIPFPILQQIINPTPSDTYTLDDE